MKSPQPLFVSLGGNSCCSAHVFVVVVVALFVIDSSMQRTTKTALN